MLDVGVTLATELEAGGQHRVEVAARGAEGCKQVVNMAREVTDVVTRHLGMRIGIDIFLPIANLIDEILTANVYYLVKSLKAKKSYFGI